MSDEEWGPWIEHTTGAMPASLSPGEVVDVFTVEDADCGFVSSPEPASFWDWSPGGNEILRYRRRRFRAEQTLREIAENIREPEVV